MRLQNLVQNGCRIALCVLCTAFLQSSLAGNGLRASISVADAALLHPSPASGLLAIVDQPDIRPRQQLLADRTLRALPPLCRQSLQNFFVRYDKGNRRGYGGKTSIILDGTVSDSEFVSLLVHECGHVMHGNLAGTALSPASDFKDGMQTFYKNSPAAAFFAISWQNENVLRKGTKPADFASGYARTDTFEDFAEFLVAYVLHPKYIASAAKQNAVIAAKLRWMQTNLPLTGSSIGYSLATWKGTTPWDMTKVGMVLAPEKNALTASVR